MTSPNFTVKIKRYLVFSGYQHYPGGGWDDFVESFDTIEEAEEYLNDRDLFGDWSQIVDTGVPSEPKGH